MIACTAGLSGTSSAQFDLTSGDWVFVAEGVYEHADRDGSVTRIAFGAGGARYDRAVLENEIEEFLRERSDRALTEREREHLAALEGALDGIPDDGGNPRQARSGGPQINASQYNLLCGGAVAANLDTHLVVGRLGATAIARGVVSYDGSLSPPTGGTLYSRATITPAVGGPITVIETVPFGSAWQTAIADYRAESMSNGSTLGSGSCTADTQSYTSFSGGLCNALNNYASLAKSYANCVTTP